MSYFRVGRKVFLGGETLNGGGNVSHRGRNVFRGCETSYRGGETSNTEANRRGAGGETS